jgi:hypothetical protein
LSEHLEPREQVLAAVADVASEREMRDCAGAGVIADPGRWDVEKFGYLGGG